MEAPKNLKKCRGSIDIVNYYRDMWPHRVHVLALLTATMGAPKKGAKQEKFIWTPVMQQAFDKMKVQMAADVLCAYPNHNKPFHIYTDVLDYQLDTCIMQERITEIFKYILWAQWVIVMLCVKIEPRD
jgi:hypothetical protein